MNGFFGMQEITTHGMPYLINNRQSIIGNNFLMMFLNLSKKRRLKDIGVCSVQKLAVKSHHF